VIDPQDHEAASKQLMSAANLGSVEAMVLLGPDRWPPGSTPRVRWATSSSRQAPLAAEISDTANRIRGSGLTRD
jgi:hypothetical protein